MVLVCEHDNIHYISHLTCNKLSMSISFSFHVVKSKIYISIVLEDIGTPFLKVGHSNIRCTGVLGILGLKYGVEVHLQERKVSYLRLSVGLSQVGVKLKKHGSRPEAHRGIVMEIDKLVGIHTL